MLNKYSFKVPSHMCKSAQNRRKFIKFQLNSQEFRHIADVETIL